MAAQPANPQTSDRELTRSKSGRQFDAAILLVLLPVAVLMVQFQRELPTHNPPRMDCFEAYMAGDLPVIFTARVLIKGLIQLSRSATGGFLSDARLNVCWQMLFAWAALFCTYGLARRHAPRSWAFGTALMAGLTVHWGFLKSGYWIGYPYDFPAWFFCGAGLLAIVSRRYSVLVLTVLIGTLNKETTLWLIPAYFFFSAGGTETFRSILARTILLAFVFCCAYEAPRLWLQHGAAIQAVTISTQAGPDTPRYVLNIKEFLLQREGAIFQNIYWALAIHLPALIFFRRIPRDLRRLYFATPFLLGPLFVCANLRELRLFHEILPLGAASLACLLSQLADESPER